MALTLSLNLTTVQGATGNAPAPPNVSITEASGTSTIQDAQNQTIAPTS